MNMIEIAAPKNRRIRDAVHGLIVFDQSEPIDQLAWKLISTREFQRLRRIRQLGVSEFTFPSAVHTRFVHSIGVFHVARTLTKIIKREKKGDFDQERANISLIAALLHDLGHGPFSHTFEGVQKERGATKRHEQWTADLIRNPRGEIAPLLEGYQEGFTEQVARLLESEDPVDIYHAVVSSSFDADRLDYLRRDRLMTGTGAGAIDFDWLMDNLRVADVSLEAPDEDEDGGAELKVSTFCLATKALPAAEQFLHARYTLHEQVYFHKTTRCAEKMIGKLLRRIAELTCDEDCEILTGLPSTHPLMLFFKNPDGSAETYLDLDDSSILGALSLMVHAKDDIIKEMAVRLQNRCLYKTLDIREVGVDQGKQTMRVRSIEAKFSQQIGAGTVIKDDGATLNIYSEVGGDEERIHKRLHILDGKKPREITEVSPMIQALKDKRTFTRFFFENELERDQARNKGGRQNARI